MLPIQFLLKKWARKVDLSPKEIPLSSFNIFTVFLFSVMSTALGSSFLFATEKVPKSLWHMAVFTLGN